MMLSIFPFLGNRSSELLHLAKLKQLLISTFCFCEFEYFIHLKEVESYSIYLFVTGLRQLA